MGVQHWASKDVLKYFGLDCPLRIEWLSDNSCTHFWAFLLLFYAFLTFLIGNVIFEDVMQARLALHHNSVELIAAAEGGTFPLFPPSSNIRVCLLLLFLTLFRCRRVVHVPARGASVAAGSADQARHARLHAARDLPYALFLLHFT